MKNIIIVSFLILIGCKPFTTLQSTIVKKDSLIIREKLIPIKIEGSNVGTSLSRKQYDSLVSALKSIPKEQRTIYLTDPKMHTKLSIMLDSLGNLKINCETIEREYQAKVKEMERTKTFYEKEIVEKNKTFMENLERIGLIVLVVIAIIIIIAVVIFIRKFL